MGAKEIIKNSIRKLRHLAIRKRMEAEKLDRQADQLENEINNKIER